MKKVVGGFLILLLVTGCSEHKLICTNYTEQDNINVSEKLKINFDKTNSKIINATFKNEFEFADDYSEYVDEIQQYIIKEYEKLNQDSSIVDIIIKEESLIIEVSYQLDKCDADIIDVLKYEGLYFEGNYNEIKTELEKDGYTCQ